MQDLQACIYLLERHIDLQQEIIQGLTHLQELHKYVSAFISNTTYINVVLYLYGSYMSCMRVACLLHSSCRSCMIPACELHKGCMRVA